MHVRCTGCLQGARHLKSAGRQGHGCCVPTAWRAPGHPTHLDSSHILTHHTSCLLACKNGMALSRSCAEGNHSLACVKERHGRLSYMCPELWGATPLLACKNGMALTRSCAEGNHSLACVKGRHGRLSYMCPELWGATPLLACKNGMALTRTWAESCQKQQTVPTLMLWVAPLLHSYGAMMGAVWLCGAMAGMYMMG